MRSIAIAICVVFGLAMPGYGIAADEATQSQNSTSVQEFEQAIKICSILAAQYGIAKSNHEDFCYRYREEKKMEEKLDLYKEACGYWTQEERKRLDAMNQCMCSNGISSYCKGK